MKLPRGEAAIIPEGKIETYCLNPTHRRGGDKARVFAAALGLTLGHAGVLKTALKRAAAEEPATLVASDHFGEHYRIDFSMQNAGNRRIVRTGWIIRADRGPPYLTTAFVLPSSHG